MKHPEEADSYMLHSGDNGCGEIAFYFRERPSAYDPLVATNVIWPDGTDAVPEDALACKHCGMPIILSMEYVVDIEKGAIKCQ